MMTFLNNVATKLGLLPNPEPVVPTPKSVRTIAKEEGVNLNLLLEILRRQRPASSRMEQEFCDQYLLSIDGMQEDEYGNFWLQIGDDTTTVWSCHTDTVARSDGFQNIEWQGDVLWLHNGKPGQCLGADDGAGIWLMLEMIKVRKPGLYIFHRDEEIGGLGSSHIANKQPQLLSGMKRAIAFDRMDLGSIITHQRGKRCCSEEFSKALAAELNLTEGFAYKSDPTGSFTDTANYDGIIPECTNLSVGYYKQHGPKEHLDVAHLYKLRDALLRIDFDALPTSRDPSVVEYDDDDLYGYGGWGGWGGSRSNWRRQADMPKSNIEKLEEAIKTRYFTLARIYDKRGWSIEDFNDMIEDYWKDNNWASPAETPSKPLVEASGDDPDSADWVDYLECYDCAHRDLLEHYSEASDGDECVECGSKHTYVDGAWMEPADADLAHP